MHSLPAQPQPAPQHSSSTQLPQALKIPASAGHCCDSNIQQRCFFAELVAAVLSYWVYKDEPEPPQLEHASMQVHRMIQPGEFGSSVKIATLTADLPTGNHWQSDVCRLQGHFVHFGFLKLESGTESRHDPGSRLPCPRRSSGHTSCGKLRA